MGVGVGWKEIGKQTSLWRLGMHWVGARGFDRSPGYRKPVSERCGSGGWMAVVVEDVLGCGLEVEKGGVAFLMPKEVLRDCSGVRYMFCRAESTW